LIGLIDEKIAELKEGLVKWKERMGVITINSMYTRSI
jgi:hypothetical protein